jgi:hypothetical protein
MAGQLGKWLPRVGDKVCVDGELLKIGPAGIWRQSECQFAEFIKPDIPLSIGFL